jgi:DNA-binding response OmpR family regulator
MKLHRVLVVEDDGKRITTFIEYFGVHFLSIIESAAIAKKYLAAEEFDFVFLDGDLGEYNGTGLDVAKFIKKELTYMPQVIVHTWDKDVGKEVLKLIPTAKLIAYGSEEFFEIGEGLW